MSVKTYDRQSGKLVARIAENLPEMSADVIQGWIDNPEGLQKFLEGLCPLASFQTGLLKFVQAANVSATSRFVAKDRLQAANIGWTGDNFKKFFLDEVEENVPAGKLAVYRLEKRSLDTPILKELGDRAKIFLAQFFELIKKQARGQSGALLVNGDANVAYVRSKKDNAPWAVGAGWSDFDRRWSVEANSIEGPGEWFAGYRVLSRK